MLDLLRKHGRLMDKIPLDDEDRDDWERLAKLVEEKFTSTNKPSAEISALIAEIYSNVPADRMYSREEVIMYLRRVETSHVG